MGTPDDLKADEEAFIASVRASKQRMAGWPDWKRQAAAATRVSETPRTGWGRRAPPPADEAKAAARAEAEALAAKILAQADSEPGDG